MSINRVIEIGRITRQPEMKYTTQGTAVTSFTLAVNGIQKDIAYFFDCVAWRSTAEYIANYGDKGRLIAIEGKLQTRTWENKEGKKIKAVEIVVDQVQFLDRKGEHKGEEQREVKDPRDDIGKEIRLEDIDLPDDDGIPF